MKKYDVTALGELLIDFTETESVRRETPYWKRTRAVLPVMCLPCFPSWESIRRSLEKSEQICSAGSFLKP